MTPPSTLESVSLHLLWFLFSTQISGITSEKFDIKLLSSFARVYEKSVSLYSRESVWIVLFCDTAKSPYAAWQNVA